MGYPSIFLLLLCVGCFVGCGGTAVIDGQGGEGGSSGPGGGASSPVTVGQTTNTSTSSGGGCSGLVAQLEAAVAAARRCETVKPLVQCDGSALVYDACGCQMLANEHNVTEIENALDLYKNLEVAGCLLDCEVCPPVALGGCVQAPGGDHCQ